MDIRDRGDDWLDLGVPAKAVPDRAQRHLQVLRDLLDRDYLTRADWDYALRDLAGMVRTAVEAQRAMVALWLPEQQSWTAVGSGGERLRDEEIRKIGSRSVLEQVRRTEKPLLTVGEVRLELDSASIDAHRLDSVLAVPLYFWDAALDQPQRRLGGCLYAHRTSDQSKFQPADVDLVLDLARLAQPTLNVLRTLSDLRRDLEASREELDRLRHTGSAHASLGSFETQDPWFARNVIEPLLRVSHSSRVNILLLGPTGSGKTHLAEAYHRQCPRHEAAFVVLDCAQVTSVETLSAELFGYAPDSGYANAPRHGRKGKAELADGGTLFIDEIATLPAELQQKLLTLLERGTFSPLGSSESRKVDLQILAATNEDLQALVRAGRFREDLYWRISDVVVHLPPLSDRVGDIPRLADQFLASALRQTGRSDLVGFEDSTLRALQAHPWSQAGNVRGLERTILRSVLLTPPKSSRRLKATHLQLQEIAGPRLATGMTGPPAKPGNPTVAPDPATAANPAAAAVPNVAQPGPSSTRKTYRSRRPDSEDLRLEQIRAAIRENGFASKAAEALGISYRQLLWKLQKAGLSIRDVLLEDEPRPRV